MGLLSVIKVAVLPEPPDPCALLSTMALCPVRTVCRRFDLQVSTFFQADILANNHSLCGTCLPLASMMHVHKGSDSTASWDVLPCERHAAGQHRKIRTVSREKEEQGVCVCTVWPQEVQGR